MLMPFMPVMVWHGYTYINIIEVDEVRLSGY